MEKKVNINRLLMVIIIVLLIWNALAYSFHNDIKNEEVINNYNIDGISSDLTKVAENINQSCVSVVAGDNISSGFIYKKTNDSVYIISTYHGLNSNKNVFVYFDNNLKFEGELLGYDAFIDLAVIKVDAVNYDVVCAPIVSSENVKDGEFVLVSGTPSSLEFKNSIELAMVSSALRTISNSITLEDSNYSYYSSMIQLSANLASGYSGSAVFNMNGDVIGMIEMKTGSNITFALPSSEIIIAAEEIINTGNSEKIQLGVKGTFITKMKNYQKNNLNIPLDVISGLYIDSVNFYSGANYGFKTGDIITKINHKEIKTNEDYLNAIYEYAEEYEFEIIRDGVIQTLKVTNND